MFKRVHSCSAGRVCCSTGHVCCYVGRLCCLAVLNAGHILRLVCCGKIHVCYQGVQYIFGVVWAIALAPNWLVRESPPFFHHGVGHRMLGDLVLGYKLKALVAFLP